MHILSVRSAAPFVFRKLCMQFHQFTIVVVMAGQAAKDTVLSRSICMRRKGWVKRLCTTTMMTQITRTRYLT